MQTPYGPRLFPQVKWHRHGGPCKSSTVSVPSAQNQYRKEEVMATLITMEGKRGKTYRIQWRDQRGHQAAKTFKRLTDARAWKAQVEHSRPDDIVAGRVSLA